MQPRLGHMRPRQEHIGAIKMLIGLLVMSVPAAPFPAAAEPATLRVVATLPPLHSLVAAIMEGAGQPALLLAGGASPHHGALAPSRIRLLHRADLVFRISERLEAYLNRPLAAPGVKARVITLAATPGLVLLPAIRGRKKAAGGGFDPHIWLNPGNAAIIANAVARALTLADPVNRTLYMTNTARTRARIAALTKSLASRLAPFRKTPYVVFHDAYHYFDRRFRLGPVMAVTTDEDRPPGARRLRRIKRWMAEQKVRCVFTEPPFPPPLAATLIKGTTARQGTLDPLGAALKPGPGLYVELMGNLANDFSACMAAAQQ